MTSATPSSTTRPRRWRLAFAGIPVLALLALVCWAFASPVGASPDDDFHLTSAWCGGATSEALCAPGATANERLVSPDLFSNSVCYAMQPEQSAECQGANFGDDLTADLSPTKRGNFDGLYPPVYYFAMSLFAGDNLNESALVMRAVNSALFVGLVTALFFLLPRPRRSTLITSILVTLVPLGIFLIPSNNPSGWAILSAATLWIALLGYFESTGGRRIALGALAAVATLIGAGARADSAIYAGVAIVAVVLLTARRGRDYLLLCILPAVLGLLSLVAFLSANQTTAASTGLTAVGERANYGFYVLVVNNLLELPGLLVGSFGTGGLGWLDTAMPAIVPFAAIGVLGGTILLGLASTGRRKSIASWFVLALVVAVPVYILYKSDAMVGSQVQPRYILPLIILLVGILLLRSTGRPIRITGAQTWLLAGALAVANAVALHTNIRRYVTGTDVIAGNLNAEAEWWWNIPFSPMVVWMIGAASFAAMLFWLARVWLGYQAGALAETEPALSPRPGRTAPISQAAKRVSGSAAA